jgi:hypothetical protein
MNTHPLTNTKTEGPLGFPLTDRQAQALDQILKALPRDDAFRYRKTVVARAACELLAGERADVSWISTEDPDRTSEVVLARGMNDSQYKLNPIVTMQHAYWLPPVGRSLWRKVVRDGPYQGVKAKTQYPVRPGDWPEGKDWPADVALSLVQADLLRGKSIGFLPTKVHAPSTKELTEHAWHDRVDLVIDEWILLEYACTFLPAQQNAVVEAVSKSSIALPDEFSSLLGLDEVLSKGAVPYADTAKADKSTAWDADAARGRLKEWAGDDLRKYRRGFAYVDGKGDNVGDYKLPHHDVRDGTLVVVFKGVAAAMGALNGARGGMSLPDADKKLVYAHLARHYKDFGEQPPELKEAPDLLVTSFTPLEQIEAALLSRIGSVDLKGLAEQAAQEALDRYRGRV